MLLYSEKMEELKRVAEQQRLCPPWERCESFPCQHSSFSTDEDYLDDVNDQVFHPELHRTAWSLFNRPAQKQTLSPQDLEKYLAILSRCERIEAKRPQLLSEIDANCQMYMEEVWGFPPEVKVHRTEEERAALKEEVRAMMKEDFRICAVRNGWST
jgi:hypothetical protein